MTNHSKITNLASLLSPTRRTVRFRLTLLYGGLFLVCGAGLLGITYALVAGQSVTGSIVQSSTTRGSPQTAVPPTTQGLGKGSRPATATTPTDGGGAAPSGAPKAPDSVRSPQARFDVDIGQSATLHHLLVEAGVALAIMAVVALALGWLVAGRVLRPLRLMTRTARQITEDNLHQRLALPGPDDELKELGDTIDGLLERLEGAFDAQRRFVANASHELRTPLTTLRLAIDVATAKPQPAPPETVTLAGKVRKGLDQIDRLLESLLALSKFQLGASTELATRQLDQVVAKTIKDRAAAIDDRNLTVQVSSSGDTSVEAEPTLLSRMVDNVVDNAIRHNQRGGWIRIHIENDDHTVRLTVESGGRILNDHEVQALAQPFRRLGAERTGTDNGSGLGLSIVAAIARAHNGKLDLQARTGGGLRVVISLPAAARPALAAARS